MSDFLSFIRVIDMEKIERERFKQRKNKKEFCQLLHLGLHTYNRLFDDPRSKCKTDTIFKIADRLNLKPEDLVRYEDGSIQEEK